MKPTTSRNTKTTTFQTVAELGFGFVGRQRRQWCSTVILGHNLNERERKVRRKPIAHRSCLLVFVNRKCKIKSISTVEDCRSDRSFSPRVFERLMASHIWERGCDWKHREYKTCFFFLNWKFVKWLFVTIKLKDKLKVGSLVSPRRTWEVLCGIVLCTSGPSVRQSNCLNFISAKND